MSPVAPSACPLCRNPFAHFASICVPLHNTIVRLFPKEYCGRDAEVKVLEDSEFHANSPEIPEPTKPSSMADLVEGLKTALQCGACRRPAFPPSVLNCGHIVCARSPCAPVRAGVPCPSCTLPAPVPPRPCPLLSAIVKVASPQSCEEFETAAADAEMTSHEFFSGDRVRLHGLKGAAELNGQFGILDTFNEKSSRWQVELTDGQARAVRPENLALDQRASQGDWQGKNFEPPAASAGPLGFVHFGRGCDGCGSFPIVGACWHCLDCPEQIGYDLCGTCKDSARPLSAGRFNQHHLPDHRMEEVPQDRTWLHDVQDARPDLTIQQILQLVEHMSAQEEELPSSPAS